MQVTVHKVGVRQLRQWQLADGCTGVLWCDNNRKSPRVGDFVLVSNYAWFGGMQTRPTVQLCFGDLGVVLAALRGALDYSAKWDADLLQCGSDYEVWEVVDDGELWQEWELMAADALQGDVNYSRCAGCGAWCVHEILSLYFDSATGESVQLCPFCLRTVLVVPLGVIA